MEIPQDLFSEYYNMGNSIHEDNAEYKIEQQTLISRLEQTFKTNVRKNALAQHDNLKNLIKVTKTKQDGVKQRTDNSMNRSKEQPKLPNESTHHDDSFITKNFLKTEHPTLHQDRKTDHKSLRLTSGPVQKNQKSGRSLLVEKNRSTQKLQLMNEKTDFDSNVSSSGQSSEPFKQNQTQSQLKLQQSIKKYAFSINQKNQEANMELYKRWILDEDAKHTLSQFHKIYLQFTKISPKLAFQKILKLIEFKVYLKPLFFNDDTSIVSLQKNLEFENLCKRTFNYNIYDHFLRDKFTNRQITEYKKSLKNIKNREEYGLPEDNSLSNQNIKIPNIQDFIQDILLVDLVLLTDKMMDQITRRQIEQIQFLGQELSTRKAEIEKLSYEQIQKIQRRKVYNPKLLAQLINLNHVSLTKKLNTMSILDDLTKVESTFGTLNLVSQTSRLVYKQIQDVQHQLTFKTENKDKYSTN